MIVATRNVVAGARKDASPQVFEVRLVIDLRLPTGIHAMSPPGSDGMTQQTVTVQAVMPKESSVDQGVQVPAFVVTSSESVQPSNVVTSETRTTAEPVVQKFESLLEVYQTRLKAKRQRSANADTIGDHETSMRAFDNFFAAQKASESGSKTWHRFCTPVHCLEHPDILTRFSEYLIQSGMAPMTVNRRLTHMAMITKELKLTVDKPTPDEVKRLSTSVIVTDTKPKTLNDGRRIPSFAEIDAIARHVSVAKYPYGSHAPYFWRGWVRFLAMYGPRSRDVVSVLARKSGLKKENVIFESLCPIADVNNALGYELHSPHGWLWYVIGKDHTSDCRKILLPMPKWMRDWIRFFFELSSHPERVFPSCQPHSKALTQAKISKAWRAIVKAAGVDPRLIPSEGTGNKIAMRKFAANWWKLTTAKRGNSELAKDVAYYVLHHAEVTTAAKHYLATQAEVLPVMLELLDEWPIPAADAPHVSLLPE